MNHQSLILISFSVAIVFALILDLGLLSRKNTTIGLKKAIIQTVFWVGLSLIFMGFIWYENGQHDAVQYISAYLLEWSLSIDNIFVFIIIFNFFKVKPVNYSRVLLLGILMAIVFRILFIFIGSAAVARYEWIMYLFGVFLVYTGLRMFSKSDEKEFDPGENWAYRFMNRFLRIINEDHGGRFIIYKNKRAYFTRLSMVVVMLGLIDIVFALDSIPAVFSIIPDPSKKLLIYSSNIFAVLGLRSLFFLLRGAASKFDYLQQGIAVVLVFIGLKMLVESWIHLPVWVSLVVILVCISGSILYSIYHKRKGLSPEDIQ